MGWFLVLAFFFLQGAGRISGNYVAGGFLIYDCRNLHFACVDGESFDKCRRWREGALAKGKLNLACAPLKRFADERECVTFQYQNIHRPEGRFFCFRSLYPRILQ